MTQFQVSSGTLVSAGLFTATMQITCEIRMRQQRLTDYMSAIEEQFFTVEKARLEELLSPGAPPRSLPFAQINRDSLLFAIPLGGETAVEATDQRRLVTVTKLPRRVVLQVPPFRIQGDMHLLRETGMRDALLASRQTYLPLTNAEAVFLPTGRRFPAGTIIVSRNRIELFAPDQEA